MANANPYAPPQAHVADRYEVDEGVQPVRTWSPSGRIGRLRYLAHMMVGYLAIIVPVFIGGFLQGMGMELIGTLLTASLGLAYFWFVIVKTIQRSHDMDWSGWTVILSLIPIVNLIWLVGSGTKGSNRYGAPPPPNTTGVKILGLIVPVIAIVGIVAAIALPAYQSYAKRAASAQVR
ncbi:MAG TPA: DUF805 domain-containing protein [Ramlibacter sp.]|uniref:DUF805 domain-containing protein n=1 Tax=Ramlibacter sp. TaxID=1917967 RepID=UPI002ED5595A